jgi:microcystin-dependent protein
MSSLKQRIEALENHLLPIGTVLPFSSPTPPKHFLVCAGQEVLKSDYPKLAEVLGDTWGKSSDNDRFRLPDLRSRFIRGTDSMGDATGGANLNPEGKIGTYQADQIKKHQHVCLGVYRTSGHASPGIGTDEGIPVRHNAMIFGYPYGWVPGNGPDSKVDFDRIRVVKEVPPFEGGNARGTDADGRQLDGRMADTSTTGGTETRPINASLLFIIKAE